MKVVPFCQPYVWENPKVLTQTGFTWQQHREGLCVSEVVNHIILMYLLAFVLGAILTVALAGPMPMAILLGIATLYCLPSFWALITLKADAEGFTDAAAAASNSIQALPTPPPMEPAGVYDVIGSGGARMDAATLPTARNPFMNVLIDEIKYNPMRGEAISITDPSVKVGLDDFFRTEFSADPTDVFGKTQSQRQFVAMPSTGIPNDQGSYQDWLYRIPGKTCKEGGREACLPGTDGGALPWLNSNP